MFNSSKLEWLLDFSSVLVDIIRTLDIGNKYLKGKAITFLVWKRGQLLGRER